MPPSPCRCGQQDWPRNADAPCHHTITERETKAHNHVSTQRRKVFPQHIRQRPHMSSCRSTQKHTHTEVNHTSLPKHTHLSKPPRVYLPSPSPHLLALRLPSPGCVLCSNDSNCPMLATPPSPFPLFPVCCIVAAGRGGRRLGERRSEVSRRVAAMACLEHG